jgi:hypothetical protein
MFRDHADHHFGINIRKIIECLCVWSASTYPLVKVSKFLLPEPNDVPRFTNDVIHNDSLLLVHEILTLTGFDLNRPFGSFESIKEEIRSDVTAIVNQRYERQISDLNRRIKSQEDIISINEKRIKELVNYKFPDPDSLSIIEKVTRSYGTYWRK